MKIPHFFGQMKPLTLYLGLVHHRPGTGDRKLNEFCSYSCWNSHSLLLQSRFEREWALSHVPCIPPELQIIDWNSRVFQEVCIREEARKLNLGNMRWHIPKEFKEIQIFFQIWVFIIPQHKTYLCSKHKLIHMIYLKCWKIFQFLFTICIY